MELRPLMRHKLRTALSFSLHDWWTLLQAWLLLLTVDLGLRVYPFRKLQRMLSRVQKETRSVDSAEAVPIIRRTGQMVDVAARYHLYDMTCLRRSLALQWLLCRRGIPAQLRFGARLEGGALSAHAWLEYDGCPIGEPERLSESYAPLANLS